MAAATVLHRNLTTSVDAVINVEAISGVALFASASFRAVSRPRAMTLRLGNPRRMVTRSRSNRATGNMCNGKHPRTANQASSGANAYWGRTKLPSSGTSPSKNQVPQTTAQRRLHLALHRPQRGARSCHAKALVLRPVAGSLPLNGVRMTPEVAVEPFGKREKRCSPARSGAQTALWGALLETKISKID